MARSPARPFAPRSSPLVVALGCLLALLLAPSLAQARPTYVSLTFDDGWASQTAAVSSLTAHGMHGTFYIPSGKVASDPVYMTWSQVDATAAAGNEIGGHTVDHVDLTALTRDQQTQEICADRQALTARGYDPPVSFAYPYAKWDASSRAAVQSCGYTSGRAVGLAGCLPGCSAAEGIPPADPYVLRTAAGFTSSMPLATMEKYVSQVQQAGGGWLILVLHELCDGCSSNAITPANFNALLDWTQGQASAGVSVRTVREMMAMPPSPPPPNLLQNTGLENGLSDAGPACWQRASYAGSSGSGSTGTWTDSTDAESGANAEQVTVTNYGDGDHKLWSTQDPVVVTPTLSSAAASAKAGTLPGGTYYYRVTATNASGETLGSNELNATTSAGTPSVVLAWTMKSGATGYRIYRGANTGVETLLASVGNLGTWTDVGAGAAGTAAPPTADTAVKNSSCSPPAAPGHLYQVSAWYKTSPGASVRTLVYYRDTSGTWTFWKENAMAANTSWTQITWTTPALPAAATAVSVAVSIRSNGTLMMDDLLLGDITTAP